MPQTPTQKARALRASPPNVRALNVARWLLGFTVLCVFALAGQAISDGLRLPVPGSVIGMVLLLVALAARIPRLEAIVRPSSETLLSLIPLLLVPLAAGAIEQGRAIGTDLLAYAVALVATWVLCCASAAGTYLLLRPRKRADR